MELEMLLILILLESSFSTIPSNSQAQFYNLKVIRKLNLSKDLFLNLPEGKVLLCTFVEASQ